LAQSHRPYRTDKPEDAIEWLTQGLKDDPEWESRVVN